MTIPGKGGAPRGKREYFPKVREAREVLRERAIEILETYIAVIGEARKAGDHETATKSLQWLIEHMPEEDGERMIEGSVDKPKQIEGNVGPQINIGFALGGLNQPKELPPAVEVIDVTPEGTTLDE